LLHRLPALASGTVAQTYSGIWGVTPDYQPIIDRLEHVPGLYCAIGFSGHGYKLSPIIGDLVSRFITGATHELVDELKLFRYSRFQENDLIKAPFSYSQAKGLR
ncbi:MAG TPA: FAD-dependent oxidoreductase, partial [Coleofasciculaceae cyanobacterium]